MEDSTALKLKMDNDLKLKLKLKMENDLKLKMESDLKLKLKSIIKPKNNFLYNGLYLFSVDNKGNKYRSIIDDSEEYLFYFPINKSYILYYEYISNGISVYQIINFSDGLNIMCLNNNTNLIDLQDVQFSDNSNTIITKNTPKFYIDYDGDRIPDDIDDDDNDGIKDIEDLDSDNDGLIDIVGLIDMENNFTPDIIEYVLNNNTNFYGIFNIYLTNIVNTNYYIIASIIAADDNAKFYQTNSETYRNAIIEFTLNTNEKIRTYQTNKYADKYTNKIIELILNTNINRNPITRYQSEYTNKILTITLNTNYWKLIDSKYQTELSNKIAEVVLNEIYKNYIGTNLYNNYTNILNIVTNNNEWVSNYYTSTGANYSSSSETSSESAESSISSSMISSSETSSESASISSSEVSSSESSSENASISSSEASSSETSSENASISSSEASSSETSSESTSISSSEVSSSESSSESASISSSEASSSESSSESSSASSEASSSASSSIDLNPPYINIINLTNLGFINTNYLINLVITDDSGVSYIYFWNDTNSSNKIEFNGEKNINWDTNLTGLPEGTNIFKYYAVDINSNESELKSITNIVDATIPYLDILSPSPYTIVISNVIMIITNSDNISGVKYLEIYLNDIIIQYLTNPISYLTQEISGLTNGTNELKVIAIDMVNHSNIYTINVIRDSTFASLQITNIESICITNKDIVDLYGTFIKGEFDTLQEISLSLNNSIFTLVNFDINNYTWYTNNIELSNNYSNYLIMRIITLNGRTNYTTNLIVADTINPLCYITNVSNNQIFYSNNIQIKGDASDNFSGIKEVYLKINDDNYNIVSKTNGWSTNIILNEGINRIYFYCLDNANNSSITNFLDILFLSNIYVATNGNDTNDGYSKNTPLKNINSAINKALSVGLHDILIGAGLYIGGNGLNISESGVVISNSNIKLIGGWNNEFTSKVGYSELDGTNGLWHLVYIKDVTDIWVEGLIIKRGKAAGSFPHNMGGGIFITNMRNSILTNIVICTNSANSYGGGIYVYYGVSNKLYVTISSNYSGSYGGGIYLCQTTNYNLYGNIINNYGNQGGGIYLEKTVLVSNFANLSENRVINYGGGVYISYGQSNFIGGIFYSNSSSYGGGIYIYKGSNTFINGKVYSNFTSSGTGGGINLDSCYNIIISNDIYQNYGQNAGGIYLTTCFSNFILGNIYSNIASIGGGIHIYLCTNTYIYGNIFNNSANNIGGGILITNSISNFISGNIINNFATNKCGGIMVFVGNNISIMNSVITNNVANYAPGSAIYLGGSILNLVISNNLIGGNSNTIGIREEIANVQNQVFMQNIFITNLLSNVIYFDFTYSNLSNIIDINDTSKTGAKAGSTNNVFTNL